MSPAVPTKGATEQASRGLNIIARPLTNDGLAEGLAVEHVVLRRTQTTKRKPSVRPRPNKRYYAAAPLAARMVQVKR